MTAKPPYSSDTNTYESTTAPKHGAVESDELRGIFPFFLCVCVSVSVGAWVIGLSEVFSIVFFFFFGLEVFSVVCVPIPILY